jgi:hypothetical protein
VVAGGASGLHDGGVLECTRHHRLSRSLLFRSHQAVTRASPGPEEVSDFHSPRALRGPLHV